MARAIRPAASCSEKGFAEPGRTDAVSVTMPCWVIRSSNRLLSIVREEIVCGSLNGKIVHFTSVVPIATAFALLWKAGHLSGLFCLVNSTKCSDFLLMEIPKLTTEEEVMFFDTDCGGVVHNIAYLRMIETCRTRLAALMGMDLAEMAKTQLFPVVVRTEIDYRSPAKLGDHLEIHGVLAEIERVRFWCEFKMVRKGEERPLVTCRQALAMVQMPAGRPQRLPQEWKGRWQSEAEAD